jgi:hypothetical protein
MSDTTNPKFTAHISLRCDETPKNLAQLIATGNERVLVASSKATSELRGLTSVLPHPQCASALDVVLERTMKAAFYRGRVRRK